MNTEDLADRLDVALDAVLAVRVALAGLSGAPLPEEALDVALGLHPGYQDGRRAFVDALRQVSSTGVLGEPIFTLEAAAHHLAGQAAEVGWMLAMTARGSPA